MQSFAKTVEDVRIDGASTECQSARAFDVIGFDKSESYGFR